MAAHVWGALPRSYPFAVFTARLLAARGSSSSLYERVAANLRSAGLNVATGQFAADMNVELSNDGPITLLVKVRDGKVVPRANQP